MSNASARRILPVTAQVEKERADEQRQRERVAAAVEREGKAASKSAVATLVAKSPTPSPRDPMGLFEDIATIRETLDRSRASDGSEGIPFLHQKMGQCSFPLWSGGERIEDKKVCGCRALTGKSWCATHYKIVYDPMRKR